VGADILYDPLAIPSLLNALHGLLGPGRGGAEGVSGEMGDEETFRRELEAGAAAAAAADEVAAAAAAADDAAAVAAAVAPALEDVETEEETLTTSAAAAAAVAVAAEKEEDLQTTSTPSGAAAAAAALVDEISTSRRALLVTTLRQPATLAKFVRHATARGFAPKDVTGRAVQVDPVKPTLKAPGYKHLKLKHDKPPSNYAFKFNLRRFTLGCFNLHGGSWGWWGWTARS